MKDLINLLSKIENNSEIEKTRYLTDGYYEKLNPDIQIAVKEAYKSLITDTGECNWDNIKTLKESGYNVFPGEKDSFGWLTGCIKTNKGIIVYG